MNTRHLTLVPPYQTPVSRDLSGMDHEHVWVAVPTHMGAYRCTVCHKVGRRVTYGELRGQIVPRNSLLPPEPTDVIYIPEHILRDGVGRVGRNGCGSY